MRREKENMCNCMKIHHRFNKLSKDSQRQCKSDLNYETEEDEALPTG
uniref:Uncharacterized protein n=1 Tax=Kalanchoe fedtschenkoi TaxID=63787 RepID=A0A7N0UEA5_KALFE